MPALSLAEFLSWVVPEGHNYTASEWTPEKDNPDGKTFIVHKHFEDQARMASYLLWHDENRQGNIWFAMASYREGVVANKKGVKRPRRRHDNVAKLRALWADIDCKPGKDYDTKAAAAVALRTAVQASAVPAPSIIVDSGNGLHCYWTFDQDVPVDIWQPVAEGFKNYLQNVGLRFDAGLTTDSARILRAPGTTNKKDPLNPKDVHIVRVGTPYEWASFRQYAAVLPREAASGVSAALSPANLPAAFTAAHGEDDGLGEMGQPVGDYLMEDVVARCAQMAEMAHTRGAGASEPLWKATLLLAAACRDGESYAHDLSDGHADYSFADTSEKLQQQQAKLAAGDAGPSRCATFNTLNPGLCAHCPHFQQIKSPIVLGRQREALPFGFVIRDGSTMRVLTDKEGNPYEELCFYGTLSEGRFGEDEEGRPYIAALHNANGRSRTVVLRLDRIARSVSAAWSYLVGEGFLVHEGATRHMQAFSQSWARQLQRVQNGDGAIQRMGWTDEFKAFDVGETRVTAGSVRSIPAVNASVSGLYKPRGSEHAWMPAMAIMGRSDPKLQAIVALAFAAPLAKLIGLRGFMFSFRSTKTGVGKTTALRMGAAVWGNPMKIAHALSDTPKSILYKMGHAPNLPAYWDEIRVPAGARDFSSQLQFLFQIVEGREMSRLTSDIRLQEQGDWSTIMGACTNDSLIDLALADATSPTPVLARMLELDLDALPSDATPGRLEFSALTDNYGHVWRPYMQYVLPRTDAIRKTLAALTAALHAIDGVPHTARFWVQASACLIVGAKLANAAGVGMFDVPALHRLMVDTIRAAGENASEMEADYADDVGEFRQWFLGCQLGWLITNAPGGSGTIYPDARRGMDFHIDMKSGRILITSRRFKDICKQNNRRPTVFAKNMVPVVHRRKASPAAGTAYGGPQVQCLQTSLDDLGVRDAVERYCEDFVKMRAGV